MSSDSNTPTWHKSSYSGSQENCVEIARLGPAVLVRDSKNPAGTPFALPSPTFHGLVRNLRFERT